LNFICQLDRQRNSQQTTHYRRKADKDLIMTNPTPPNTTLPGLSVLDAFIQDKKVLIRRGIEKEGLRANADLDITQTDHPAALGHPLTHASITTDYSEALLELITSVHDSRTGLFDELSQVHEFVQSNIGDELLWPGSMPCRIDGNNSIRIAEYGNSNIGQLKTVYRRGLDVRYGRIMQSIAGLHYNFSLSDELWLALQEQQQNQQSLTDFKSERYFSLIRNFRRHSWLLMYLFGASPVLDESFVEENSDHGLIPFDEMGSLYKPHACSLRMGDLGYHNNAQADLNICFNTLENFTHTLGHAVKTPYPAYEAIGVKQNGKRVQLNTNILQIENEYYSSVRPKRTTRSTEKPTEALIERGVEYIEVRCMDLNPMLPLGIDTPEVDFIDLLLMHSLLSPSGYIDDEGCAELEQNFSRVVNEGRKPCLSLQRNGEAILLADWGTELIKELSAIAEIMDKESGDNRFRSSLETQAKKISDVSLTPSAQILAKMQETKQSWLTFAAEQARQHRATSESISQSARKEVNSRYQKQATDSLTQEQQREAEDTVSFNDFLKAYQA